MFERFTERARHVLFQGLYEARCRGALFIGTRHLLLGLVHEDPALFRAAAKEPANAICDELEKELGAIDPQNSIYGDLPLGHSAKRSLAKAREIADQFHHPEIGAQHVLAGILQSTPGLVARLVSDYGIDTEATCHRVATNDLRETPFERSSDDKV